MVADREVDGLGAGVQAGQRLVAQSVFAAGRGAAEVGGPLFAPRGQGVNGRRAGGQGLVQADHVRGQVRGFTEEGAAPSALPTRTAHAACAR